MQLSTFNDTSYTMDQFLAWGNELEPDEDYASFSSDNHVLFSLDDSEHQKAQKVGLIVALCAGSALSALHTTDPSFQFIAPLPGKVGNLHRDREGSLLTVRSWDDDMFRRQFRLHRSEFNALLALIEPKMQTNVIKAINSSGSTICPELRLLVTLRILAGASYLDMIWYCICVNHCIELVVSTCELINSTVHNISFPSWENESEYRQLAVEWQRRIYRKFGAAGEGILDT